MNETKRKAYNKFHEDYDLTKAKPEYLKFAQNLSALMAAKNIDGESLANILGLKSASSISMYRNGQQFPKNPEQLIKLAATLDTTVDELLGNTMELYLTDDDLLYYAESLGVSPVAVSNMKSLSFGSKQAKEALDIFLSHSKMSELMLALQEMIYEIHRFKLKEYKEPKEASVLEKTYEAIINGRLYVVCRAFEKLMEDIVRQEKAKSIPPEVIKEVTDAQEE